MHGWHQNKNKQQKCWQINDAKCQNKEGCMLFFIVFMQHTFSLKGNKSFRLDRTHLSNDIQLISMNFRFPLDLKGISPYWNRQLD